jgi:hypothetical protein
MFNVSAAIAVHPEKNLMKSRAWRFDMRALSKFFVPLLATLGLASCGGGGGGSHGAFTPPGADSIFITPGSSSITTNSFTALTITVKKDDGSAENDGIVVNASVSPSTIGTVSGASGQAAGTTASNTLSGGKTSFNFTSSNQAGAATITISLPAGTNGNPNTATNSTTITVTGGNTNDPRLQLNPTALTLPISPYSIGQQLASPFPGNFIGSPYVGEVSVTWRHSNGQLVSGTLPINVSIDKNTVAGFSTLDDPTTQWTGKDLVPPTTDGNEFLTIFGSGPVNVTGGVGSIFVHAGNVAGTANLTITATDPDNNQTISAQLVVTIAGSGTTLPSSIFASSPNGVYISGSNGAQSTIVSARVTDGSNTPVADSDAFDNVEFKIVGPAGNDARLTGVDVAGHQQTGTTVVAATHQGVANVTFQAGTQQGPVQVRATADRGDGNVDNGIQDPVTATTTVVVSDGKLFSLTLTSPGSLAPSILINRVSTEATLIDQTGTGGVTIPPDSNATYSFTVSAIGNDRQGNPVLPGTTIKFGSIDSPVDSNGVFAIQGTQGDPKEGTNQFDATDGHFLTAGGGVGPGDTLLVFGKLVQGNSDLESAAKVTSVASATRLFLATPFNLNDTTGQSVDDHAVIPYIVGRAQIGNITSPSTTDSVGAVSTTLNYPVSALGHTTAVWAQGTSTDTVTGGSNLVTDIALLVFPGIAPAKIVVSPNPIPGNITIPVFACIYDALGSPLAGVNFSFAFSGMGVGSGSLDGISTGGVVPDATDASGCVQTTVVTNGIAATSGSGTGSPTLTFSAGDASTPVPITASGGLVLLANPSALGGAGGEVTLTLLNSNGTPVPGVQLTGTCTGAGVGFTFPPPDRGVTRGDGTTAVDISASLDGVTPGSGSCTFTTATGSPTATVNLQGVSICGVSPQPPGCGATGGTTATIHIAVTNTVIGQVTLSSTPSGFSCNITPASATDMTTTQTCNGSLPAGDYTFSVNAGHAKNWNNACGAGGTLTVPTTLATQTCSVDISPTP